MKGSKNTSRAALGPVATILLSTVAVVWLGLQLLAMRTLLAGAVAADPGQVANLVISLSGLVVGTVYAGGVAGVSLANLADRTGGFLSRPPRIVPAAAGGLGVGVVMATASYLTFAESPDLATLVAATVGVAGLLGGCVGAIRSVPVVTAGLSGTAVLLAVFVLRAYFMDELLSQLGRDVGTYRMVVIVGGLVAGLCVGVTAFLYLRRHTRRVGLYGFILAGATPGALWLLGELVTQIAASWLTLPGEDGTVNLDNLSLALSAASQFNGGLTTLFAGATTAVLAFGILLPKRPSGPATGRGGRPGGAGKRGGPPAQSTGGKGAKAKARR
ncbi:hypothetical protein [Stackebrandtia albiflava]|uniref:hypothetical protein n=1 Tax=Stackebrandtia albiflava TaxID=406432 RepID=UPI0011BE97EE|nr:hypothetical protein [Stackebrandtia albiflava]